MKRILVIFGSMSSEHEVSCISAYNVLDNIDKDKYEVTKLGISKEGIWYEYIGNISNIKENKWIKDIDNCIKIDNVIEYLKKYDVVFPVLHGKYGEDGTIQGVFELANVKYVGCKVLGSSIAMDKTLSKELVKNIGINVVPYVNITRNQYSNYTNCDYKKIEEKISFPMFVKPNKEGSSYGVNKAKNIEELKNAIEYALQFDDSILVEKYIQQRKEVECAVIEKNGKVTASTPGMIVIQNEVYDFDSKYNDSTSYTKIPADINEEIITKIKEYAIKIFRELRLNGLSRVDFFVTNEDKIYFNEVNTMPGFTSISMYPKMLMHDGIAYKDIIDILIENC